MKFSSVSTDALLLLAATSSTWMTTSFGFVASPNSYLKTPVVTPGSSGSYSNGISPLGRLSFTKPDMEEVSCLFVECC